jgi:SAM-dependent methyltransferase
VSAPGGPRGAVLDRVGLAASANDVVRAALDEAITAAEEVRPGAVIALDAGCGRVSALARFRPRLARVTGVDLHEPPVGSQPHLDAFVVADVCRDADAFAVGQFDVILSSFTIEHFIDPDAALANLRRWLRPGGRLVVSTVNRRHPFVAAYLDLPVDVRAPAQRLVKADEGDAHPLVGACNDPASQRAAHARAGVDDVRVTAVGHLARAWARRWPTFVLGLVGDVAAQPFPARRSTLVAVGTAA